MILKVLLENKVIVVNEVTLQMLADHLPIQLAAQYGEKCALSITMYQRTSRVL